VGTAESTHTTIPTSPTMSSPSVPSHDGNQQLGYSAKPPIGTKNSPADRDSENRAATSGCGNPC
jgi:hypothetical protein